MADRSPDASSIAPALAKRERLKWLAGLRRTWRQRVVDSVDQLDILSKVAEDSGLSPHFIFMTLMSAAIAMLGLLQSSPAVVIGAMLLSPLMGPIIGAGFALAVGDARELRRCARTLAIGAALGVGIAALIVYCSPIQTVTSEIAARTRPTLFDLLVALFSALAGAYAMIRGRAGSIVGVAIATALMPPLAVVGFGLATFNWTVFGGSLLLFATNLMTIALSAAVMARFYGFSTRLTKKQTWMQTVGILTAFALLSVPLGLSLRQIAWETAASREARAILQRTFPPAARITQIEIDHSGEESIITASVLTPEFNSRADALVSAALQQSLGRPVSVRINQYKVGTEPGEAEAAELAAATARAQEEADSRQASVIVADLAMVTGLDPNDILVDREHRRAVARARLLPGASLATYQALEQQVTARASGWRVELVPPMLALPSVSVTDGRPEPATLATVAWASQRLGAPVVLSGADAAIVRDALVAKGVAATVETGRGSPVAVRWAAAVQPPGDV